VLFHAVLMKLFMTGLVAGLLLCCSSDVAISYVSSSRAMLLFIILLCLRCEWILRQIRAGIDLIIEHRCSHRMVRENFELGRTVMHMSDQHALLCEIRAGVFKSIRYSKDVLIEIGGSPPSHPESDSTALSPPSLVPMKRAERRMTLAGDELQRPENTSNISRARDGFRKSVSFSESDLLPHRT
jgi:hypothetical protein